jgi:hypothetical protein
MSNTDAIKSQRQWIQRCFLVRPLILCLLLGCFHVAYAKIKTPSRSQFTSPPQLINDAASQKNCLVSSFAIKEGIHCFNNQQFNAAKIIFQRVKKASREDENNSLFFTSQMYLAFIDIEQNKISFATKKINHLYRLRPDFTLQKVGIDNKKYVLIFKKVKQHRLTVSKKGITNSTDKKINTEIECSLRGNCDHEITCIIAGNCNDDIECSLAGTCNKN